MERSFRISQSAARWIGAGPLALLLAAVSCAGCGGSRAVGRSAMGSHDTPIRVLAPREDPYSTPIVARVQPRQLAAFALLRAKPEGLPAEARMKLRGHMFGINWRLAHRIPVRSEGDYWLVPGDGYLCVLSQGVMGSTSVGTTCAPTQSAIAHGLADVSMTFPHAGHPLRVIVGVAPAGTREVLISTRGRVAVARVRHGVFVLRDSTLAPPDSLSPR